MRPRLISLVWVLLQMSSWSSCKFTLLWDFFIDKTHYHSLQSTGKGFDVTELDNSIYEKYLPPWPKSQTVSSISVFFFCWRQSRHDFYSHTFWKVLKLQNHRTFCLFVLDKVLWCRPAFLQTHGNSPVSTSWILRIFKKIITSTKTPSTVKT